MAVSPLGGCDAGILLDSSHLFDACRDAVPCGSWTGAGQPNPSLSGRSQETCRRSISWFASASNFREKDGCRLQGTCRSLPTGAAIRQQRPTPEGATLKDGSEKQATRLGKEFRVMREETCGVRPVHDAMVIGQVQRDHRCGQE